MTPAKNKNAADVQSAKGMAQEKLRAWLLCGAGAAVLVGVGYGLDLVEKHYFPSGGPAEFVFLIFCLLWVGLTALFTFVAAVLAPCALRVWLTNRLASPSSCAAP